MLDNSTKDSIFKTIFADEKSPELLEILLYDILKKKYTIIEFLEREQNIDSMEEKTKIVDVLVKCEEEIIHIEVNSSFKTYTRWRNYIYLSKIISSKMKIGESYCNKTKYISINLTRGMSLKKDVIKKFMVRDKDEIYLDNVEIYEVNVDKAKTLCYTETVDKSIMHIGALRMSMDELERQKKGDIFMEKLSEKLKDLSVYSPWFATEEEDYHYILNTERLIARDEGLEEGRKEGLKKGIETGTMESKKEIAKKMLKNNLTLDLIITCTGLSKEEIDNL